MKRSTAQQPRRGAAAIFILLLTSLLFIAIVFSIDIARIQLAKLELQSAVDLSARAGAEALARGVGDPNNHNTTDAMLRAEIEMIANLNSVNGNPLALNTAADIQFGEAKENGDKTYSVGSLGSFDSKADSIRIIAKLPTFPVVFGGFVSRNDVSLVEAASSMIRERDIVLVLDRSGSMLEHDAGSMSNSDYEPNLRALEDAIYGPGEAYYPGGSKYSPERTTEFVESGGVLSLSRTQALKLAVLKFRQEIDNSRGLEKLGLTSYSEFGDAPNQAVTTSQVCDIVAGLSSGIFDQMVGDGITYEDEHYASALEKESNQYRNFDYNYLAMRRGSRTNIVDGLQKGNGILFGSGHRTYAIPVLILMTDGKHNLAGDPVDTASALMAANPELRIYTVTFGDGADQATMSSIATIGRGTHHHATDVYQLVTVFQELANSAGVTLIQ